MSNNDSKENRNILNKSVKMPTRWNLSASEDFIIKNNNVDKSEKNQMAGVTSGYIGKQHQTYSYLTFYTIERFDLEKYNPKVLKPRQR